MSRSPRAAVIIRPTSFLAISSVKLGVKSPVAIFGPRPWMNIAGWNFEKTASESIRIDAVGARHRHDVGQPAVDREQHRVAEQLVGGSEIRTLAEYQASPVMLRVRSGRLVELGAGRRYIMPAPPPPSAAT